MKKIIQNLALLFLGIFIGLLVAEAISRIVYTKPWYERLVEEQVQNDWTASVRRNSLGLRDQDYPTTKPSNSKRVLILGDSFTYGSGVADNAAIFPELLEKQLNAEFAKQGMTIEILNGGMPGSLTEDWVELLLKVKDSFQPDVILIVFFLRDGTRTSSMGSFFEPIRNEIVSQNQKSSLYQNVYLYRFYKDAKDRQFISENYAKALNESYLGNDLQTQEWRIAQFNIRKMKAIGEETQTKVALVVFPVLAELNDRYPFKQLGDVITNFALENEIPTHNLLPAFMGKNAPDLWVSALNQHPNALGHEIAANSILPFLRHLLKE